MTNLLEITTNLITSMAQRGECQTPAEMAAAIETVYSTLRNLQQIEQNPMADVPSPPAAISQLPIATGNWLHKNYVVCIVCGQKFKRISAKHLASHRLTPKEYKKTFGIPQAQALWCRATSQAQSEVMKATWVNNPDKVRRSKKNGNGA